MRGSGGPLEAELAADRVPDCLLVGTVLPCEIGRLVAGIELLGEHRGWNRGAGENRSAEEETCGSMTTVRGCCERMNG